MAESTEVTVLEGVAFDSVSAFLIAAVLGSAKGPICMVSACSDSDDDEPCKPLGIVNINKPSFIVPRNPPLESIGVRARRHCNKGFRDVFESHGLIQTSLSAEGYRGWLSRVAYTSDCMKRANQETTGTPLSLCVIVDEQLISRRDSFERMGTSTTPIPSTPGQSQDQVGEGKSGGEEGSGYGQAAEEEENSDDSETRNLGSANKAAEEEEHSDNSESRNHGSTSQDDGAGDDEHSEQGSGTQNHRPTIHPSLTNPEQVTPVKNAVIHLIFGDEFDSQNPDLKGGERRKMEIVPLETKLGGVLSFLNPLNQIGKDEQTNETKDSRESEEATTNSIFDNEMQPKGVAARETFRNVSKRDQRGAGRKPNVVQYSSDLETGSEMSTDLRSDDNLQMRIEPGTPNETGNFSTDVVQASHEWRQWILEQLRQYNGTNETDILFPLTREEANLFHDFLENDDDGVDLASTVDLSTILAVRHLLVRLQKVKERQGWFGTIFGISAVVTLVASVMLFTKNSRLLVRYARERAREYRLLMEAKRREQMERKRDRLIELIAYDNPVAPIIVSKKAGSRGWEDAEANFVKEPCEPPCQAMSRCEACWCNRRYTESWTEKEVKIGSDVKVKEDKVAIIRPSSIPKKYPRPKELVKDKSADSRVLLPPRDSVYPRLSEDRGGVVVDTPPPGYPEASRVRRFETPSAPIGIPPISNWGMGGARFENAPTEADLSFVRGELKMP